MHSNIAQKIIHITWDIIKKAKISNNKFINKVIKCYQFDSLKCNSK
jgi:hypothetical protein